MISTAVILVLAIVTTYFIHIWVEHLAMKKVKAEKEQPSYISDLAHNIVTAEVELDKRMLELKDELSEKVAKELPRTIITGKDTLTIYLLSSFGGKYIAYPVVKISDTQYNLIKVHSNNKKWLAKKLLNKELGTYVKAVDAKVDYGWEGVNNGIKLYIRIKV